MRVVRATGLPHLKIFLAFAEVIMHISINQAERNDR